MIPQLRDRVSMMWLGQPEVVTESATKPEGGFGGAELGASGDLTSLMDNTHGIGRM